MGKVIYHWDDLRHNALDSSPLRLAAIAGTESFHYCIADSGNVPCAVKGFVTERKYHFFDKPLGYLKQLTAEDELLYADFNTVQIAVRGVPFVTMLASEANDDNTVARLQEVTDISKSDEIYSDVTDEGLVVAFTLPQAFAAEVHAWFSDASIIHVISALIMCGTKLSREHQQPVMLLNINSGFTEMICCQAGQLLFANHYRTLGPEDVLYYALAVLQNLRLETDRVLVNCTGHGATGTLSVLQTYLPLARYFSYADVNPRSDYPLVETTDLIAITKCAS